MRLEEQVLEKLSHYKDNWPMLKNNLRIRERREKIILEVSSELLREVRRIKEESIENLERE